MSFDLRALGRMLDFINLMTYDMGTGFSAVSTFNAPLREVASDPLGQPMRRWNNVTNAVRFYRAHGVPADRLVLGVPFYGSGFQVTSAGPTTGSTSPTTRRSRPAAGATSRSCSTIPTGTVNWHPVAASPWLYNSAERRFVSFETPESILIRAKHAKKNGLLGTSCGNCPTTTTALAAGGHVGAVRPLETLGGGRHEGGRPPPSQFTAE